MRTPLKAVVFASAGLMTCAVGLTGIHAEASRPVHAATAAQGRAKVWAGRNREFEEYMSSAEIDHFEVIPVGVTHPRRAFLKPGGLVESVAWKVITPGRPVGYWESYKSEIAAYELDKLLGLDMVPVTVEKRWKGETAAAILWLSPIRQWKEVEPLPKPAQWDRQVIRMKMFDNLIGNGDRNKGNLLVDDEWQLFLIDHSRAFVAIKDLPVRMEHIDRRLWSRMQRLNEPAVSAALGAWLDRSSIRVMLARRDRMAEAIARLVGAHGEAAVFVD
ncbi:MAG: hypothetical protein ABJC89_22855 [Acidobacteriota bacterium]